MSIIIALGIYIISYMTRIDNKSLCHVLNSHKIYTNFKRLDSKSNIQMTRPLFSGFSLLANLIYIFLFCYLNTYILHGIDYYIIFTQFMRKTKKHLQTNTRITYFSADNGF